MNTLIAKRNYKKNFAIVAEAFKYALGFPREYCLMIRFDWSEANDTDLIEYKSESEEDIIWIKPSEMTAEEHKDLDNKILDWANNSLQNLFESESVLALKKYWRPVPDEYKYFVQKALGELITAAVTLHQKDTAA